MGSVQLVCLALGVMAELDPGGWTMYVLCERSQGTLAL